jgi:hypothetical protein
MKGSVFVDLRNVYTRREAEAAGFTFHCVGKRSSRSWTAEVAVPAKEQEEKEELVEAN